MQHVDLGQDPNVTFITPTAPMSPATHGGRAKCLQRLVRLDLPVPKTVALSFDAVHRIAEGTLPDVAAIEFGCCKMRCIVWVTGACNVGLTFIAILGLMVEAIMHHHRNLAFVHEFSDVAFHQ